MRGRYPCHTSASRSGRSTRVSLPSSSKRQSSTRSATSLNSAKLVPPPSYVAPRGYGDPGQTFTCPTLARVAQDGADALARGLLDTARHEPHRRTRAERRPHEDLLERGLPGLLHSEI